ncbi:MAG: ATP-binding protein [Myxococcota bacterium]|nr:ATP-binding protein [Myxococcota bacterium]
MKDFERPFVNVLRSRLEEEAPLIQTVVGPRQVGKTTGLTQILDTWGGQSIYASADDVLGASGSWIRERWQEAQDKRPCLLVIDEIQKVDNWAETIKSLWDSQTSELGIKLVLLGSSSRKLQRGLTESLAGRFEQILVGHWSFEESNRIQEMSMDEYLKFGGYPGSYRFIHDEARWHDYLLNSIIEPVVNKDILSNALIKKPALFRQMFSILASYPSQEMSLRKLLGQLQDRGNTDIIKNYLRLYEGAYLFRAIPKFSNQAFKVKTSSPKVIPLAPCFYNVVEQSEAKLPWVFESVVGAALLRIYGDVYWWRDGNREVDFVYKHKGQLIALEVKSGRKKTGKGLEAFIKKFPSAEARFITRDNFSTI